MTKNFKIHFLLWLICFAIFNIITFTSPAVINITFESFWIGYAFIIFAFLGQLTCSYIAFKEENINKMFYNISLILISYSSLLLILIIGIICMIAPMFPVWISIALCLIITGFLAFVIIFTCLAINVISNIDKEISTKTFTMKKLTANAEHLMNIAESVELKFVCKKVYEVLRYSDPINNIVLSELNEQIQNEFRAFEISITDNDVEMAKSVSIELINLIDKRNKECTLLK